MAKNTDPEANTLQGIMGPLHRGRLVGEIVEELADVVAAVKESGKKGSVVITLTVDPIGRGQIEAVNLNAVVNGKCPQPTYEDNVFFIGDQNRLHRRDPDQKEMEFREVEQAPAELRRMEAQ